MNNLIIICIISGLLFISIVSLIINFLFEAKDKFEKEEERKRIEERNKKIANFVETSLRPICSLEFFKLTKQCTECSNYQKCLVNSEHILQNGGALYE